MQGADIRADFALRVQGSGMINVRILDGNIAFDLGGDINTRAPGKAAAFQSDVKLKSGRAILLF